MQRSTYITSINIEINSRVSRYYLFFFETQSTYCIEWREGDGHSQRKETIKEEEWWATQ